MSAAKQMMQVVIGASLDSRFKMAFQSADKQFEMLSNDISQLVKQQKLIKDFEVNGEKLKLASNALRDAQQNTQQLSAKISVNTKRFDELNQSIGQVKAEIKRNPIDPLKNKLIALQVEQSEVSTKNKQLTQSIKTLSAEIKENPTPELKEQLKSLRVEKSEVIQKNKKLRESIKDVRLEIKRSPVKDLNKHLKTLQSEQRAVSKESNRLNNQFERSGQRIETLNGKLSIQQDRLLRSRQAMEQAGLSARNYAAENDRLSASIDRLNAKRQRIAQRQQSREQIGQQFGELQGKALGMAATGATAGVAMMPALSFERATSVLQAKSSGMTNEEKAMLEAQAKQLGKEMQFTATQAVEGMTFLSMAGFNATDIKKAAPGMLELAAASGLEIAESADIASNILSGFSLKAGEMGRVGDVLAATFTSSNVTLDMLGETMKYVAPVASKAGAGIEEVATMSGLLGNVGIQGSMAGTALRAAFTRLSAPPKAAAKQLKKLGIETMDANKNLLPMPKIIAQIHEKTKNLGTAEQAGFMADVFGVEAMAAMQEVVAKSGDIEKGYAALYKKIKNSQGKTSQIAQIMNDNALGALGRMKSAFEGFAITVGEIFSPALQSAFDAVASGMNTFTTITEKYPNLIKGLGIAAASIAAVGVASLVARGSMLLFRSAGLGVVGTIARLSPMIAGMGLLFSPLGVAAIAVAGGIYLLAKHTDGLGEVFDNVLAVGEGIGFWIKNFGQGVAQSFSNIKTLFFVLSDGFKPLGDGVQWLGNKFSELNDFFSDLSATLFFWSTDLKESGDAAQQWGERLGPVIAVVAGGFVALKATMIAVSAGTAALAALAPVIAAVGKGMMLLRIALPFVAIGIRGIAMALMANPIGLAIGAIAVGATLIISHWDGIVDWFDGIWQDMKAIGSAGWDMLKQGFLNFTPLGIFISRWESIPNYLSSAWEGIKSISSAGWSALKQGFFNFTPLGIFISRWESIPNYLSSAWEGIKSISSAGWSALKQGFFNFTPLGIVISRWEPISGYVSGVFGAIKNYVFSGISAVTSVIAAFNPLLLIKAAFEKVFSYLHGLPQRFANLGNKMIGGLKTGVKNMAGSTIQGVKNVGSNIVGGVSKGIDSARSGVSSAVNFASNIRGAIADKLKIRSPSQVTMRQGEFIVQGLGIGIQKAQHQAISPLQQTSSKMVSSLSIVPLAVASMIPMQAAAQPADALIKPVTPLVPLSPVVSSQSQSSVNKPQMIFNVYQAPNESNDDLVERLREMVREEMQGNNDGLFDKGDY